jgi:hypothetical protein
MSLWITVHDRIVVAVRKHVIAQDSLVGACVGIGINESAQVGIVIAGLEVVERSLSVVDVVKMELICHDAIFNTLIVIVHSDNDKIKIIPAD